MRPSDHWDRVPAVPQGHSWTTLHSRAEKQRNDMSLDATALEKLLRKSNRSYEESVQGVAFIEELCKT